MEIILWTLKGVERKEWFRKVGQPGLGESLLGWWGKERGVVGAGKRGEGIQEEEDAGEDQEAFLQPVSFE